MTQTSPTPDMQETSSPTPGGGETELSFELQTQGEASVEQGSSTCVNFECCRELSIELIRDSAALAEAFGESLPGEEMPTEIAFETDLAILSFVTMYPKGGKQLSVTRVSERSSTLYSDERLDSDATPPDEMVRPYNLVTVAVGEYDAVEGELDYYGSE